MNLINEQWRDKVRKLLTGEKPFSFDDDSLKRFEAFLVSKSDDRVFLLKKLGFLYPAVANYLFSESNDSESILATIGISGLSGGSAVKIALELIREDIDSLVVYGDIDVTESLNYVNIEDAGIESVDGIFSHGVEQFYKAK